MILEYIIEDSKYKDLIKGKIPQKGKNGIIKVNSKKFSGVNNYILTIEYSSSPVESAETLSAIFQDIKEIFDSNKVKYYILRNEASIEFANRLYPLVCEFETKLRKFLYVALFDLDEAAKKLTTSKIKTVIQKFSKTEKIPQSNFLEELTLGEVFNLLFDNREFLDSAKNETKQIENTLSRKATKRELISIIERIEEKTLWNELFAPIFKDFSLPTVQNQLFNIRNDIMHFHFITYEQYKHSFKLLKGINNELDIQLAKGIVLENNEDNAILVSNNYQYTFTALSAVAESLQAINKQLSAISMSSVAPIIGALSALKQELTFPILDIANNLQTAFSALYESEDTNNLLEKTEDSEESEKTEDPESPEALEDTKDTDKQ
ncbi:MAG: hypothetical protein ACI4KD_01385 [Oscillospiraceae bacterium]